MASRRRVCSNAAWLRVLQGRRPPSEQWPRANNQQRQRQSGNVQRSQKPQVQDERDPGDGCRRRWRRVGHSSELSPPWSDIAPSTGEVDPNGPVVKRCRREDFVPHCDEEMQEWMQGRHADHQAAVAGGHLLEVARVSQPHHHCCSGVAGVDQPTVSCNAIFCCTCRGIHGAITQFSSMRLRRQWGWRGVRVWRMHHTQGPVHLQTEQVVEKGGSIQEMPAHTDRQ